MKHHVAKIALSACVLFAAACSGPGATENETPEAGAKPDAGVLNIYSARHYPSDQAIYDSFEAETGIHVRARQASADQLIETMKAEGDASPADLIISSDMGALWRFKDAGLTQPVSSPTIDAEIPDRLRDPEGHWFGLSRRLRGVVYDPARISVDQVDEWSDLTDPSLKGEICVRSSSNVYNLSLMGEMIARWGEDEAQNWANGVVANMARAPQGGDTGQIKSVSAGECGIAISNHYYWVRLLADGSPSEREDTARTKLIFPSFDDGGGVHVNMTGASVAANAPHPEAAIKFIEFLATPEAQTLLVTDTKEIPINADATLPTGLDAIPSYVESDLPLEVLGENQPMAQMIYDRAGWN